MKKLKKFILKPGLFFRDYFNKKYPVINNEQSVKEEHETIVIENTLQLENLESSIQTATQPIDIVFTWVDSSDVEWQKKYQKAQKPTNKGLYSDDPARFNNHNELYYSLYSVIKFLPWVNKIYIVTDNQKPKWLDRCNYPNVHIIDHKDIIEEQYLPTFNSHVIEAFLYKIPNLSENFIYFNDDVFVARNLSKEHFFRTNGVASLFASEKKLNNTKNKGNITPTFYASLNSINLLKKIYQSMSIDIPYLVHSYVPLKKSMYELAWSRFENEIRDFLPNTLRTNNDINMATFLVPWMGYLEGKSVFTREICYYFNIRSAHALAQYKKLLQRNYIGQQPHSFCINDPNSKNKDTIYIDNLNEMLEKYYLP